MKGNVLGGLCAVALCLFAGGNAYGAIVINELQTSTTGSNDPDFIELYNSGPSAVDISGWSIELWDSDFGASFGGSDGASPYVIGSGITLGAGEYFLFASSFAVSEYSLGTGAVDFEIPDNGIENSAFTVILADDLGDIIESIYVADGGAEDKANRGGVEFTPNYTIGPDGSFLPGGFYRVGDGSETFALLEFSPRPAPSATPGFANIPQPGPASLVLVALGGLAFLRRRRE